MRTYYWLLLIGVTAFGPPLANSKDALTVGLAKGYEPYQFIDDKGVASGFDIDVAKAVFDKLKLNYQFSAYSWDDVMSLLRHNAIDVAVGAEISAARMPYFLFTEGYYTRQPALLTLADNTQVQRVKDLIGQHITGDRHSSLEAYLSQLGLKTQFRIEQMESKKEAISALAKGNVKAVIMPKRVAFYLANKIGIKLKVLWQSPQPTQVAFGVSNNNPDLVNQINDALDALRADGTLQRIKDKWSINVPVD